MARGTVEAVSPENSRILCNLLSLDELWFLDIDINARLSLPSFKLIYVYV